MKDVIAHWTVNEWTAIIGAIGAVLVNIVLAVRNGMKLDQHEANATARARMRGELPAAMPSDERSL